MRCRTYRAVLLLEQALARLTGWHGAHHTIPLEHYFHESRFLPTHHGRQCLMVYAGTIGEYNAITSFISAYFERWPNDQLVVLMASRRYFSAVASSRPNTVVGVLEWRSPHLYDVLFERTRPRFLVIAEAPCLHGYFRPRFELGLLATCLAHRTVAYVVNSCFYDLELSSRTDQVENALFGDLHRKAIRRWFLPSSRMADRLAKIGVPPQQMTITGNLKFDALGSRLNEDTEIERSAKANAFAKFRPGPIFVGGNVNFIDEQKVVVDAWRELRIKYPDCRLVIAPRYLENKKVLPELLDFVTQESIHHGMWSAGVEANRDVDLLVLDTYGDLFHFYGIATVCYAGRNHGVLEPLSQGKPTLASDRWEEKGGGVEIYEQMIEADALIQVRNLEDLGAIALRLIEDEAFRQGYVARAEQVIRAHQGAGMRTFKEIERDYESELQDATSANLVQSD